MVSNDKDLIERFKTGNVSAFEELMRRYQDRVYNLCRHMTEDVDDARDVAQEVFIKAYGALKSYKPDAGFYTWLYRIAVNTCLDFKRKRRVPPLDDEPAESLSSGGPSPEELYESKETGRIIDAALQSLPRKLRAVIVLREMEGPFLRRNSRRPGRFNGNGKIPSGACSRGIEKPPSKEIVSR